MALIIKTSFLANASKDRVWELITDIEKSAPCFPGAVLGEKMSDGFYQGGFNVKLGPMTFNFSGKFGFTHLDHPQYLAKISASGTDTKGRGGAQGLIDVELIDIENQTQVNITSDVTLSGSVAQYGRGVGMIQAISQQLINEFGKNLSAMIVDEKPSQINATVAPTSTDQGKPVVGNSAANTSIQVHQLLWQTLVAWIKNIFTKKS
jgi:carbon monoxide dehydrogenase subunit G